MCTYYQSKTKKIYLQRLTKNRFLSLQPLKGRMCNEGSHHLVDSPEPMEQLTFIFCVTTVRWKDVSDWTVYKIQRAYRKTLLF